MNLPVRKNALTWTGEGFVVTQAPYYGNSHNFGTIGFDRNAEISGYGLNGTGKFSARVFDHGLDHELNTLPGYDGSSSYGLNTKLLAVGISYKNRPVYATRPTIGTFWSGTKAFALPPLNGLPDSRTWAINEAGTCVGLSYEPESGSRNVRSIPTVWVKMKPSALPLPQGATQGEARNINDSGDIVGTVTIVGGRNRACIWRKDVPTILPSFHGDEDCRGVSINNHDIVVGRAGSVGFLWDRGRINQLTYPGAPNVIPITVNDSGWVLANDQGESINAELNDEPCLPLLFRPGKGVVRVAHLLPSGSRYMLLKAMGLNENGQIAVGAAASGGKTAIFVLSPQK